MGFWGNSEVFVASLDTSKHGHKSKLANRLKHMVHKERIHTTVSLLLGFKKFSLMFVKNQECLLKIRV